MRGCMRAYHDLALSGSRLSLSLCTTTACTWPEDSVHVCTYIYFYLYICIYIYIYIYVYMCGWVGVCIHVMI